MTVINNTSMKIPEEMSKINTDKGKLIERPDGTRISGFIKGDISEDNPKVWCVNCIENVPEDSIDIKPIIESIVEMRGGRSERNSRDFTCNICSSELPID